MDPLLSHMGASHISALLGNDLLETPKPNASEQDAGDLQGKGACVSKTPLGSHGSRLKWGGGGGGKAGSRPVFCRRAAGDGDARTGAVSADEAMKLGLGLGLSGALGGSGPERRTRFGPRPSPPAAASGGASARCASGCGPGPSGPSGPSGPNAPAAHADATVEGVRVRVSRIHSRPGPGPKYLKLFPLFC